MYEILSAHIGPGGLAVTDACWELYCLENGILPDGTIGIKEDVVCLFLRENCSDKFVPRSILVNAGSIKGNLVAVTEQKGLSNIYVQREYEIEKEILETTLNRLRELTIQNDQFKGCFEDEYFEYCSSLTTEYTPMNVESKLELILYQNPKAAAIAVNSDVVSIQTCKNVADVANDVVNQALYDICRQSFNIQKTTYTNLNEVIAKAVSALSAAIKLIPYPHQTFIHSKRQAIKVKETKDLNYNHKFYAEPSAHLILDPTPIRINFKYETPKNRDSNS